MSNVNEEQSCAHMHKLLAAMTAAGGSDLFIASDFPPSIKVHGSMQPLTTQKFSGEMTRILANATMNARQREESQGISSVISRYPFPAFPASA